MYIKEKRIQYYDSMNGGGERYLNAARRFLRDEAEKLGNKSFNHDEWDLIPTLDDTPQQHNGTDCGVFTVMFADFITDNLPLQFSQQNIELFRRKICANILRGELNYPLKTCF